MSVRLTHVLYPKTYISFFFGLVARHSHFLSQSSYKMWREKSLSWDNKHTGVKFCNYQPICLLYKLIGPILEMVNDRAIHVCSLSNCQMRYGSTQRFRSGSISDWCTIAVSGHPSDRADLRHRVTSVRRSNWPVAKDSMPRSVHVHVVTSMWHCLSRISWLHKLVVIDISDIVVGYCCEMLK